MSKSSSKGHCLVVRTACCGHVGWLCTHFAQRPKDSLFSYMYVCVCCEMVVVQVAELAYLLSWPTCCLAHIELEQQPVLCALLCRCNVTSTQ